MNILYAALFLWGGLNALIVLLFLLCLLRRPQSREDAAPCPSGALPPLHEWPEEAVDRLIRAVEDPDAYEEDMEVERMREWLEENGPADIAGGRGC